MNKAVIDQLVSMRHSPIRNYIIPGLTSWLIMDQGDVGKVRMFECTREQNDFITPHSHRFDFSACVVKGQVENTIWRQDLTDADNDLYVTSEMVYRGRPGLYETKATVIDKYKHETTVFKEGDWYQMQKDQIHSIKFSRGAMVLFFEGRIKTNTTHYIEPYIHGERVPTMKVEPWMFKKVKL